MIALRKQYIHWSKIKLPYVYFGIYGEKISSWQFQRVIQEFKLYPPKKVRKCVTNGAKRQLISWSIRQMAKNLFSLDANFPVWAIAKSIISSLLSPIQES